MVKIELARGCLRAFNKKGQSCTIGRTRSAAMAKLPVTEPEFRAPGEHPQPRPACAGKSILELIWDELMEVYGELKAWKPIVTDPDHPDWEHQEDAQEHGELIGLARGLATAISIIVNPYNPNVDAVREEAARRWAKSKGETS